MQSFDGRVVVISGAAGGIGRALAQTFAAEGARLALIDKDAEGLDVVVRDLALAPGWVTSYVRDVTEVAAFPALVAAIEEDHGALDVLINNAGLTVHGRFGDHTPEELDRVIDVDLRAALHLTHTALPALRRAAQDAGRKPGEGRERVSRRRALPGAHVVIVASMAGVLAFPFQSVYSAAKHGLRGFGQALRMELAAEGIGVTTILPGTIATGFLAAAASHDPEMSDQLATLMRRFGTPPEHVARAILGALRSDRAERRVGWDCQLTSALRWLVPPLLPGLLGASYRWQQRHERDPR